MPKAISIEIAYISDWLAGHSLAVQAFAAIAGIVLTAALVVTTIIYVRLTGRILDESQKSREAAESQAKAAVKQAEVAERNLAILQSEIQERSGTALAKLKENVSELNQTANHWFQRMSLWGQLTPQSGIDLLPSEWSVSIEHARRISPELGQELLEIQRSSRKIALLIEQFCSKAATYRRNSEADEIKGMLAEITRRCPVIAAKLSGLS